MLFYIYMNVLDFTILEKKKNKSEERIIMRYVKKR